MKLIIGDKNLSSWSMRAWLVAKISELPFEEILVQLNQPKTKLNLEKYSSSAKVPCLIYEDICIWDSLAICEFLADSTDLNLWPKDKKLKAIARSYVSEMHSGFFSMREQLSMDLRLKIELRHLTEQTIKDIDRVLQLWTDALIRSKGPFLFGEFGIVDAFFAPVVFRFLSYGIHIKSEIILNYMKEIQNFEHVQKWVNAGVSEIYKPHLFNCKSDI